MHRGLVSLALEGDETVVEVRGDLDIASVDPLRSLLRDLVATTDRRVVVDLSGVDFCDSSGVAVLASAARAAEHAGFSLAVRRARPQVEQVLRLTGCGWLLPPTVVAPDPRIA